MRGQDMSWAEQVARRSKDILVTANVVRRKIAIDLFSRVIYGTPVDTGRARANWQCTIGSPASGTVESGDKSGGSTAQGMTQTVNQTGIDDDIYLSNNLPYIRSLEYEGHSKQAPVGMVRINLILTQNQIQNILTKEFKK